MIRICEEADREFASSLFYFVNNEPFKNTKTARWKYRIFYLIYDNQRRDRHKSAANEIRGHDCRARQLFQGQSGSVHYTAYSSNEVKKLEIELGITIFSRNKHGVQVTDAGRGISGMFELAKFLYKRLADRISPKKELRNIHFRGSFYIVKNYGIPFFLAIDKHS